MTITADNAANNNTFLKELEYVCHQKKLNLIIKKQYKVFGSCNQSNGTRDFKKYKSRRRSRRR